MSHSKEQRRTGFQRNLRSLWRNWSIGVGCLIVPIVLSSVVAAKFIPIIAFGVVLLLMWLDRNNRGKQSPECFRLPFIIVVSLTLAALAISVSLMIDPDTFRSPYPGANTPNPFLTVLLVGPCSILVSVYYLVRGNHPSYCQACVQRNGDSIDRGVLGAVFHREIFYQTLLYMVISIFVTGVTWWYYIYNYVEINVNKADQFYFIAIPTATYLFSIVYIGVRYHSMWGYYSSDPNMMNLIERSGTTLRYIIICGDDIFLSSPRVSSTKKGDVVMADDMRIDTPAVFHVDFAPKVSAIDANKVFYDAYGIRDVDIKYLYESNDYSMCNNVAHYCAYLADEGSVTNSLKGEWFAFGDVVRLSKSKMISNALTTELKRVCTIAMTAKTYDIEGQRLYRIKHYRPTFTLEDLRKVAVDFNDSRWLAVAETNADKRFFRLRKAWKRVVKGVEI